MRIFAFVAVLVACAAAKGSGPYLPSGWRPQGAAFFLPSEVEKPKESPVKDIIFQESEASGSDSFQEYGPPKVDASLDFSKQGLPDAVTEQVFAVIEVKVEEKVEQEVAVTEAQAVVEDSEANLSQQSFVQETVPVTESLSLDDGTTTLIESEVIEENIDVQPTVETTTTFTEEARAVVVESIEEITEQNVADVTTNQQVPEIEQVTVTEVAQQENENANSNIVSTFQERVQVEEVQTVKEEVQKVETEVKKVETEIQKIETQVQNFESEIKTVVEAVQNIPEVLNSIDTAVTQQQIETVQDLSDANVALETFGSLEQAPEGFLEYGPPGFKEYGPPKEDAILPELQTIETNEAKRRRRFSPKFRTARKTKIH